MRKTSSRRTVGTCWQTKYIKTGTFSINIFYLNLITIKDRKNCANSLLLQIAVLNIALRLIALQYEI